MSTSKLESLASAMAEITLREGLAPFGTGCVSVFDRDANLLLLKRLCSTPEATQPSEIIEVHPLPGTPLEPEGTRGFELERSLHEAIYRAFQPVTAALHFHSPSATAWSQAGRDLPCFGTLHASSFKGVIPCTRPLTTAELCSKESPTLVIASTIVSALLDRELSPGEMPGILIRHDGAMAWGASIEECLHNAGRMEAVAALAIQTLALNPAAQQIPPRLLRLHQPF